MKSRFLRLNRIIVASIETILNCFSLAKGCYCLITLSVQLNQSFLTFLSFSLPLSNPQPQSRERWKLTTQPRWFLVDNRLFKAAKFLILNFKLIQYLL